jgi:hypothetical protein
MLVNSISVLKLVTGSKGKKGKLSLSNQEGIRELKV